MVRLTSPLAGLAQGLGALLIAITGCAAPVAPTSTAPAPTTRPAVDQKVTVGASLFHPSLDPYIALTSRRVWDIFDALLVPDEKGEPKAALATAWKTTSPTTWQFTIRTDVKFSDGSPMTAEDVKFSFDRALDPAAKFPAATRIQTIVSTSVLDATTVEFRTSVPDPILLRRLINIAIVPKGYLSRVGKDVFANEPVGSGAFRVKEYRAGDLIVLTGNLEHPFRKPKLRELTLKNVPEASARVAGIQSGDLDIAIAVPIDQGERLTQAGYQIITQRVGASTGFIMGTVRGDGPTDAPTADKRVRQALNYAIDKETIAKQIYRGYTTPQGQLADPETIGYNPDVKAYPYNPVKARELLVAAGQANGFTIRAEASGAFPELQQVGLAMQQNLRDIGITLEFQMLTDLSVYRAKQAGTQPRPPLFGGVTQNLYDADFSLVNFSSKQAAPLRHYNNSEFDRLYDASQAELDPAKRRELLQKAIAVFFEGPPFLFIVGTVRIDAIDGKRIQGAGAWSEGQELNWVAIERIG